MHGTCIAHSKIHDNRMLAERAFYCLEGRMEKSTVYFTDFRCPVGTSQLDKLKKVCLAAGIKNIDMDGKFVAIKMHFGELGNLAFLRPNYAKAVADLCKAQGGVPFLTDCRSEERR